MLATNEVHVQIDSPKSVPPRAVTLNKTMQPAVIDVPTQVINNQTGGLRTIELSSGRIREGFSNGDIIVTLLPVNTQWPWITPAKFRPELVPEELMAQGLTVSKCDI